MTILDTEAIRDLGWADATFHGFVWENEGRDLKLHLDHASKSVSGVMCHGASDLRVDLHWMRPQASTGDNPIYRGGSLLNGECTMDVSSKGRWSVMLDFASDGKITFDCEKITVVSR